MFVGKPDDCFSELPEFLETMSRRLIHMGALCPEEIKATLT